MLDPQKYSCIKEDGFIYMFRDGEIVRRPKQLYENEIERELQSMTVLTGYIRVEPGEFDRLSAGSPLAKEMYWHEDGKYWSHKPPTKENITC